MIAATLAAYLLCYGGLRGPVDWLGGGTVHRGRGDRRRVALSFDDGPDPVHTPALLDALAELDVKATFFVVGAAVDAHPALCRRIAAEGHELGNHTYRHPSLPLHRGRRVAGEIAATDRAIAEATGQVPHLARPPYGGRSPWTVRTLARLGKRTVLWDVNPFDWRGGTGDEIAARVLRRARPGSIVLLHDARDGGDRTVAAVRRLVPQLRARGYELATVGALLAGGDATLRGAR
jgi:peptidoglycan/xylan/chitin deacetylase (PgdA/CDA1 family)